MSWFKRKPLPTVPDDAEERSQEKIAADIRLNEARELAVRASEVVDTLNEHNTVNHYAKRLRKTFELAQNRGT